MEDEDHDGDSTAVSVRGAIDVADIIGIGAVAKSPAASKLIDKRIDFRAAPPALARPRDGAALP